MPIENPEAAQRALKKILAGLPDRDREIIELKMEGVSFRDIAERLGVSLNVVRIQCHRIISRLRPLLEEEMRIAEERVSPTALPVFIDAGDAPVELITELFVALACAHKAVGGSGLQVTKDERRSLVGEVQP